MDTLRDPRLDGLRALAVIAVIAFHQKILPGGELGVDVFFVLSGCLITGILVREYDTHGQMDLPKFFSRRARRLLPALALLLVVYAALMGQFRPTHAEQFPRDLPFVITQTMNFAEAFDPHRSGLSHTWTLAIEWQFYLAWPFVLMGLLRLQRQAAFRIVLGAWAGLTLLRIGYIAAGGSGHLANYLTPFHVTGLMLGAALALKPPEIKMGALGLTLIGFAVLFKAPLGASWVTPIAEIGAGLVILAPPRFLAAQPLPAIGLISYGVYLWHLPVYVATAHMGPIRFPLEYLAAFSLATASYWLVERRFLHRPQAAQPHMSSVTVTAKYPAP